MVARSQRQGWQVHCRIGSSESRDGRPGFDAFRSLPHRQLRNNRTSSHRQAMLRNMANSLLRHEVIKTTVPKAKELRKVVEPLITLGKKPSLANRRLAFDRLRDRDIVVKIFDELGPRFSTRNGGYLRILKCGFRDGDNAPMAFVELLDRPDVEDAAEGEQAAA